MIFLTIFVIIPLIEVGLFLVVGDAVGIAMTLMLCVLTAMIGAALIRQQGLQTLASAHEAMQNQDLPVQELFDGICLAIAGVTLMTPGFFTDAIGFILLVPQIRAYLREYLAHRIEVHFEAQDAKNASSRTTIIEGEFKRLDDDKIE